MAEISIVPLEEISLANRWDGEFYRPYFRQLGEKLSRICKHELTNFAAPSVTPFSPESVEAFQYVEISDIDLTTGEAASKFIPSSETPDRAQFLMQGGEILVSTVRPNRSGIGLLPCSAKGFVASSGFAPLLASNDRWRSYLFVWLKLQAITDWLDRHSKASMYPAVTPADILHVPILKPNNNLLEKVHSIVKTIEATLLRGKQLYPEAEQELLERIGWEALQQSCPELFYVEELDSLNTAGRIDAEHFQPQYRRLRERLNNIGAQKIGALCNSIAKGTQPDGYTDDGQVTVVKSKNVFGQGIDFAGCERTNLDAYSDVPARLSKGDVVVNATGFGTLGRAAFIPEREEKIVASVDLVILRLNEKMILPEYATLFLNSPAGLAQSEMFQTGSSGQLHLYPQHIQEFLAYLPRNKNGSIDLAWQQKLADKVVAGSRAKQEAQAKLNEAKQLVEKAIEAAG